MSRHNRAMLLLSLLAISVPGTETGAQTAAPDMVASPAALPPIIPVPEGDDDRAYLLRKQRDTFRLNVDTDYAVALQKLCQTGYADTPLCLSHQHHDGSAMPPVGVLKEAGPATPPAPLRVRARHHLPIVQEIIGLGGDLAAVLMLDDGQIMTVTAALHGHPASVLPTGETIVAVEPQRVLIKARDQAPISLFLGGPVAEAAGEGQP